MITQERVESPSSFKKRLDETCRRIESFETTSEISNNSQSGLRAVLHRKNKNTDWKSK